MTPRPADPDRRRAVEAMADALRRALLGRFAYVPFGLLPRSFLEQACDAQLEALRGLPPATLRAVLGD